MGLSLAFWSPLINKTKFYKRIKRNYFRMAALFEDVLPCTVQNDVATSYAKAQEIFEDRYRRFLPEFYVHSIECQQGPGTISCRWVVKYKYRNINDLYVYGEYGKNLVKRFYEAKPTRSNILKPAIKLSFEPISGYAYVIEYGRCNCPRSSVFGDENDSQIFNSAMISAN